jgi:HAD superfamily hydrolase (TIGR01509 family)
VTHTLVLDAMGVIFASADDVRELLRPFIAARGGLADEQVVVDLYRRASLGKLTPDEFWHHVGLDASVEDEYLVLHRLSDGVTAFLESRPSHIDGIWCLSNDVGRWSQKLRRHFKLNDHLAGAVISGDVGARKPDEAIYRMLISRIGVPAEQIVFVDDRPANLAPARQLGIRTVQFGGSPDEADAADFEVSSFAELAVVLRRLA